MYTSIKERVRRKEVKGRSDVESLIGKYYTLDFTDVDGDPRNPVDFRGDSPEEGIVGDVKWFKDPEHVRYHNYSVEKGRYYPDDFQIDYYKCNNVCEIAKKENRTPWIIAFFYDYVYIWDLNKCNWKETKTQVPCNNIGVDYGRSKRMKDEVYLKWKDAIFTDNPNPEK